MSKLLNNTANIEMSNFLNFFKAVKQNGSVVLGYCWCINNEKS